MLRGVLVGLEEVCVVQGGVNRVVDVVGFLRIMGDKSIERFVAAIGGIGGGAARRVVDIVGGKKAQQLANHGQAVGIVWCDEVRNAAGGIVGHGAAEFLLGDFFVGDGLDDVGTRDKHVRSVGRHENEIGDGGRMYPA